MTDPKVIRPYSRDNLDHFRTAIFALQLAAELTNDEDEIAGIYETITQLRERVAQKAKGRVPVPSSPRLRHVSRPEVEPKGLNPGPGRVSGPRSRTLARLAFATEEVVARASCTSMARLTPSQKARADDGWLGNQILFGLRERSDHGREAPGRPHPKGEIA